MTVSPRRSTCTDRWLALRSLVYSAERRVGRGHLAAVDRLDGVAVLQADAAEDRLRPDGVELEAVGLAVLDRRHEARRRRQHGRVRQQLVDERAVDGAGVAGAVDALVDVAELGLSAGGGGRRRGDRRPAPARCRRARRTRGWPSLQDVDALGAAPSTTVAPVAPMVDALVDTSPGPSPSSTCRG